MAEADWLAGWGTLTSPVAALPVDAVSAAAEPWSVAVTVTGAVAVSDDPVHADIPAMAPNAVTTATVRDVRERVAREEERFTRRPPVRARRAPPAVPPSPRT
ncbi:hypothetical protein GCM10028781_18130 [Nostocoides australiense]